MRQIVFVTLVAVTPILFIGSLAITAVTDNLWLSGISLVLLPILVALLWRVNNLELNADMRSVSLGFESVRTWRVELDLRTRESSIVVAHGAHDVESYLRDANVIDVSWRRSNDLVANNAPWTSSQFDNSLKRSRRMLVLWGFDLLVVGLAIVGSGFLTHEQVSGDWEAGFLKLLIVGALAVWFGVRYLVIVPKILDNAAGRAFTGMPTFRAERDRFAAANLGLLSRKWRGVPVRSPRIVMLSLSPNGLALWSYSSRAFSVIAEVPWNSLMVFGWAAGSGGRYPYETARFVWMVDGRLISADFHVKQKGWRPLSTKNEQRNFSRLIVKHVAS